MVPLLVLWTGVPQHRANGTSLLAIIPIAVVAAGVYYFHAGHPQVDLGFALLLVVGSVVGVYLGARAMSRIPEARLKAALGVLLVIVGFKELLFP
jgi:uncharacterized membrane protein YfcA